MTTMYQVWRFASAEDDTLGALYRVEEEKRIFLCFTLEDEYRAEKIRGETRVPAGTYKLELRPAGRFHQNQVRRYKDTRFHRGMIHVTDVPNFKFILIHPGNDEGDTMGCLLVGEQALANVSRLARLIQSRPAYERVYLEIADAIEQGDTYLQYIDFA